MASYPYYYFSDYQEDIGVALQELRQHEFEAGRYDPAMRMHASNLFMGNFQFPPDVGSIAPGAKHSSIEEAVRAGDASGTGSILDIQRISDFPNFLTSSPLPTEWLMRLFGTDKPTRELVERVILGEDSLFEDDFDASGDLADEMGAGGCRYFVVYKDNEPSEIFFMGYSVD